MWQQLRQHRAEIPARLEAQRTRSTLALQEPSAQVEQHEPSSRDNCARGAETNKPPSEEQPHSALLAGRWSSSVQRTGNFIFTIRGKVEFPLIFSYSRFLLAPFPGAELTPTGDWTWAQLRGVPIWNEEYSPRSQEELLTALRANPAFEHTILTILPRWQIPVERLEGKEGTVAIAFCDPDGTIARQAQEDHIFMFNSYVKFSVTRSRPPLIQCTCCHQLGHTHNSRACRAPTDALICYKCGGPHRSERHVQECHRVHRDIAICDCPPKCILCRNLGHHARDPKCPQRAAFAPPRNNNQPRPRPAPAETNNEGWTTVGNRRRSRVRARPAYRGTANTTGKGKEPERAPSPSSRFQEVDDTASESQVERELLHSLGKDFSGDGRMEMTMSQVTGHAHKRLPATPPQAPLMSKQLTKFSLASVNMGRHNTSTHSLLNANTTDHIIFMQEPWFSGIGTARSNNQREGVDILGAAANPKWEIIYPASCKQGERIKVVTYLRLSEPNAGRRNTHLSALCRTDLCAHPCLQMLDIWTGKEVWRALNFYNDVSDPSTLDALTALDLDPTIPTILVGDFNTHSPAWSSPSWNKSPHADRLESWLTSQTFALLSEPGRPTCRSTAAANERDSVLDLIWVNEAAEQALLFALPEVNWADSLRSDHALMRCTLYPNALIPWLPKEAVTGYKLDSGKLEEWLQALKDMGHFLGIPPMESITDINLAVDVLFDAIDTASSTTFEKRRPPNRNKCSRWWNPDCENAVRELKEALSEEDRATASKRLKKVTQTTKRKWADEYIQNTGVWDLAKWRHGRRITRVSTLRGREGDLIFDHADMADALAQRFFNDNPAPVDTHFYDDPPPCTQQEWSPISPKETEKLLSKTSNTASPGLSGVGYLILKWSWGVIKDYIAALFNACATTWRNGNAQSLQLSQSQTGRTTPSRRTTGPSLCWRHLVS